MKSWQYCPACGLPFWFPHTEGDREWILYAYGFETSGGHRIFEIEDNDFMEYRSRNGKEILQIVDFEIIGGRNRANLLTNNNENDEIRFFVHMSGPYKNAKSYEGVAIHRDCVIAIEQTISHTLTYKDAIQIATKMESSAQDDLRGYNDVLFDSRPDWMFESPLKNKKALYRIVSRLPDALKETTISRARSIHTLVDHIEELPRDFAPHITEYLTGFKPHEYMPEKFTPPRGKSMRQKQKSRRQSKRQRRAKQTRRR